MDIANPQYDDSNNPPECVLEIDEMLDARSIWHLFSRNPKVLSCRDAANKRFRLGHTGIPLRDELKSFLGYFTLDTGEPSFVAVHCRADRDLDFEKIKKCLSISSKIKRVTSNDENDSDLSYGLVNPFQLLSGFKGKPVMQIFDQRLLEFYGSPETMMTNAGEYKWAVEFNPKELIQKFGGETNIADVVCNEGEVQHVMLPIGILTGNGPDSGMLLWSKINSALQMRAGRQFSGDISYPEVRVVSMPGMGLSMELDAREKQVKKIIESGIIQLGASGAKIISLACNTTQYYAEYVDELCSSFGGKFISMEGALTRHLDEKKITDASLIGIKYITDRAEYSGFKQVFSGRNIETISDEGLARILELGYLVKKEGASERGLQKLYSILNKHTSSDNIIIALTEISVLLAGQKKQRKSNKNIIDILSLYASAIADECYGSPPRQH